MAVDAIAGFADLIAPQFAAGLAPHMIIGNDDRVAVQQHTLQPAVRTDEDARLFAEPGEDPVEHHRETGHRGEQCEVVGRRFGHELPKLRDTNDVGKQRVRDQDRDRGIDDVLHGLPEELVAVPG